MAHELILSGTNWGRGVKTRPQAHERDWDGPEGLGDGADHLVTVCLDDGTDLRGVER